MPSGRRPAIARASSCSPGRPRRPARRSTSARSLTRFTANTITNRPALFRELAEIRRRGHPEDDEEFLTGMSCLAVPARNARGRVVTGLTVSAPSARFNLDRARAHLPDLRTAATEVGRDLNPDRPVQGGLRR
jgi:IclR family transcriptional regulator, acetate operon repressor